MSKLKWSSNTPRVPGIFLRCVPETREVHLHSIYEIDGQMCINDGDIDFKRLQYLCDLKHMLWYGPIPEIPKK